MSNEIIAAANAALAARSLPELIWAIDHGTDRTIVAEVPGKESPAELVLVAAGWGVSCVRADGINVAWFLYATSPSAGELEAVMVGDLVDLKVVEVANGHTESGQVLEVKGSLVLVGWQGGAVEEWHDRSDLRIVGRSRQ